MAVKREALPMTSVPATLITAGLRNIRRELMRYAFGMTGLALMLLLIGNCASCSESTTRWLATGALGVLSALSIWTISRLLRRDPSTIWSPALVYPLSTLLYFGFGSSSALFADEATRYLLMSGNYAIDATGLLQTTLLTSVGVAICLYSMVFATRFRLASASGQARIPLPATAIAFVVSGALLKYGLVLPEQFGLINVSVPGTLKSMTGILDLGFATMAYMAARGQKMWLLVFLLLWPIHFGLSLLEFSKRVMMLAILLPAAGTYLAHGKWHRLIPWILFAAVTFYTTQDVNTTARLALLSATGTKTEANYSERLSLFRGATSGELDLAELSSDARAEANVAWLRLNYSGAQLRAMELYDNGQRGEWTLSIAATLIPRFLWPDKPEATAQGRIFNRLVSGHDEASTRVGVSIYADGYWTMGWSGVILFSAIMGMILGVVIRINYSFVMRRELIFFPVVFLGLIMSGLGPMGYLQKSFVAAMPIYIGYLIIFSFAARIVSPSRTTAESWPRGDFFTRAAGQGTCR